MSVPILACLLLAFCSSAFGTTARAEILVNGLDGPSATAAMDVVVGCTDAAVQDSGMIIYILVPRTCSLPDASELLLQLPTARGGMERIDIPHVAFDHEYKLRLVSGGARVLSLHRRGTWRGFPNLHSWHWRDGAGLLVKDGQLYLLGGWTASTGGESEVWRSSNARDWTLVNKQAPWPGRHASAWLTHGDKLVVAGGDFLTDVWESVDGEHWQQLNKDAAFGARYTPMGVTAGSTMLVMGGQIEPGRPEHGGGGKYPYAERDYCTNMDTCSIAGLNDVWASNDGKNWAQLTDHAPWRGRSLVHGGLYFKGRVYVVGGGLKAGIHDTWAETYVEFSDVWSSADGRDWRLETTDMGFTPRTHAAVVASPTACYVVGGSVTLQTNVSNEVFFATDCVHFQPIPDPSPMQRRHAAGVSWFNGSLVVMGGPPYGGEDHADPPAGTTVWQYFPDE